MQFRPLVNHSGTNYDALQFKGLDLVHPACQRLSVKKAILDIREGNLIGAAHLIDAYISELSEPEEIHFLDKLCEAFSQKDLLLHLAGLATGSSSKGTGISGGAIRHPLGMYRWPLLIGESFRVRMHVWIDGVPDVEEVHDHKCSFSSRVLHGGYTNFIYQEDEKGIELEKLKMLPVGADHRMSRTGTSKLSRFEELRFSAGGGYAMHHSQLHAVGRIDPLTVTLTVRGRSHKQYCKLFMPADRMLTRPSVSNASRIESYGLFGIVNHIVEQGELL